MLGIFVSPVRHCRASPQPHHSLTTASPQPHHSLTRASPEPEELGQHGADQTVDEDVGPHQLAGQLKRLKAGVVEQEEARPQQQQVEQAHKAWDTDTHGRKNLQSLPNDLFVVEVKAEGNER